MWGVALVALALSLAILKATPPTPEPRGARAFLLPFAIPVAIATIIVFIVTGIGVALIIVRDLVEQASGYVPHHVPGQPMPLSPGAGAAIAVALVLTLIVLLGCAYLASKPSHERQ
jgi:hypothetical protein